MAFCRLNLKLKGYGTQMKKILCLALLLVCTLSFVACTGATGAFIEVVNSSKPTKIVSITHFKPEGETALEGKFVTLIDGDEVTFEFEYQQFCEIAPGKTDRVETVSGTVYYKNGKYSTDGENWFTEAPELGLGNIGLNLTPDNLGDYTLTSDQRTLFTTLSAEEAAVVLGIDALTVDEDGVYLTIDTNGTKLVKMTVSYSTGNAEVSIETSYEYLAPEAPAPENPADNGDEE